MAFILPRPGYFVKQRFLKRFRHCRQALVRIRYLIILNNWSGRSAWEIERVLKIHNTTVYRVVRNFRERGKASLWDGREDNGRAKLCPEYWGLLDRIVRSSPQEHGWHRPTWTSGKPDLATVSLSVGHPKHGGGRTARLADRVGQVVHGPRARASHPDDIVYTQWTLTTTAVLAAGALLGRSTPSRLEEVLLAFGGNQNGIRTDKCIAQRS
jgi:hypothetical protein